MGCYNEELLFIHIPKCAGWSCKHYLKEHLPGMLMPDDPKSKLPIGHVRLADIERFTGRPPASFQKILAVIRDPYEQQLSQWAYCRDRYARGCRHVHDEVAASHATLTSFLMDPRCNFYVYYEQHHGFHEGKSVAEQTVRRHDIPSRAPNRFEDCGGYYWYWLAMDGQRVLAPNLEIIRQDELDTAFPRAVAEWFEDDDPPPMPRLNTSPHGRDMKQYYTPAAAKLVEEKFDWAFQEHYEKWLWSSFAT